MYSKSGTVCTPMFTNRVFCNMARPGRFCTTGAAGDRPRQLVLLSELLFLLLMCVACVRVGEAQADVPSVRPHLSYTITEERQANTLIGTVGRNAGLDRKYGREVFRKLTYSVLGAGGRYAEYFSVNPNTGELRTAQTIDRETLCQQEETCDLQLDVAVKPVPVQFLLVVQVTISVLDINDHPPTFPSPRISLAVSEGTDPGAAFVIPLAKDTDSKKYGVKGYSLLTTSSPFSLQVRNGPQAMQVSLKLRSRLDRERLSSYTLQVVARDAGVPPKSGTLTVDINVVDANDNSPRFLNTTYNARVREDTPPGTRICRVEATDPDDGPNGHVIYGFTSQTYGQYGKLFGIQNNTGDVFLRDSLDYEDKNEYILVITATDLGEGAVPSLATLNVTVQDTNDKRPTVTVNPLTESGRVEVRENADPGVFVAHIKVQDGDTGSNGEVICSLDDGRFDIQIMYTKEYKITTAATFDRELNSRVTLSLNCADQGVPRLESSEIIVVDILDENDNDPIFTQETYTTSMSENKPIGHSVIRVNATDADAGPNADITYRLSEKATPYLTIHDRTGVIYTKAMLDYEKMNSLEFMVEAVDHGVPIRTGSAEVILVLIDVNDEPPVFSQPSYRFGIFEMEDPGKEVGSVHAIDTDSAPFNDFSFSLDPNRSPTDLFRIDSKTGKITTRKNLDREAQPLYTLWVLAVNPGRRKSTPALTSSVEVEVYVMDKNDNAPMIIFPSPHNQTVYVPVSAPLGYMFTKIVAKDADVGANAQLTFSIAQGDTQGIFVIDPNKGSVTVRSKKPLDRDEYKLLITVTDRGEPKQKTAIAGLTVMVNRSLVIGSRTSNMPLSSRSYVAGQNQIIVISVAAVCVFIVIVLLIAIIIIKTRQRQQRRDREVYKYTCRADMAQRMGKQAEGSEDVPLPPVTNTYTGTPERTVEGRSPDHSYPPPNQPGNPGMDGMNASGTQDPRAVQPREGGGDTGRRRAGGVQTEPLGAIPCREASGPIPPSSPYSHPPQEHPRPLPRHRLVFDTDGPYALTEKDIEVHHLLRMLIREPDSDSTSGCSADMSNTDSGRGASEDGDGPRSQHAPRQDRNCSPPPLYDTVAGTKTYVGEEGGRMQDHGPHPAKCVTFNLKNNNDSNGRPGPRETGSEKCNSDSAVPRPPLPPRQSCNGGYGGPQAGDKGAYPQYGHVPHTRTYVPCSTASAPDLRNTGTGEPDGLRTHPTNGHYGGHVGHHGRPHVNRKGPHSASASHLADPQQQASGNKAYIPMPKSQRHYPNHQHKQAMSTFGHAMPMTTLSRVDETQDEISDSDATTTSGSFMVDDEDPHYGRIHLSRATPGDTVV